MNRTFNILLTIGIVSILVSRADPVFSQTAVTKEVIASSGGTATGPNAVTSWTLGEVVTFPVYQGNNLVAAQGFQKEFDTLFVSVNDITVQALSISIYPNPTYEQFTIKIPGLTGLIHDKVLQFYILDMEGKQIITPQPIREDVTTVNLGQIAVGMYILTVVDIEAKTSQNFKLQVIN